MSKAVKKIASIAAPVAAAFVPGLQPFAPLIGAATGAMNGGGLKGALMGGISSFAGNALSGSGSPLLGSVGGKLGAGGFGPPTPGTGLLGALSKAGSGLSSLAVPTAGGAGGLKSILSPASTLISGYKAYQDQDKMKKQLQEAQARSEAALSPYAQTGKEANSSLAQRLSAGFAPDDLASDPGYQFRLEQGQKSINRSLGAQGSLFSGKALKAASEYGQGTAASEYDQAYKRWLEQNNQLAGQAGTGLQAAGGLTGVYDNQGNINANATLGKSNVLNSTLSRVLNGSGSKNIVGYRPDGTPIYDSEELVDA